ncbi:MAG TPA: YbhB/YbcL family Raf kinase inhibitor-like protein [Candidatus Paceibacterota bacterium]|nr:YbhB/YbcL family Raf kinase inhibitor-like protein [Candidatus Paceibacterota bacterium]
MTLMTEEFGEGEPIPTRFTCDGENISPLLLIGDVPDEARSLAITMHDPDVPKQLRPDGNFDHWVVYNIASDVDKIPEGGKPGLQGINTAGKVGYTGPCPPPQYEPSTHRYIFTLYALDAELPLQPGATKEKLLFGMEGRIVGAATLMGTYSRKGKA